MSPPRLDACPRLGIPSVLHAASGPHLRGFKVPREASAEASRAAAGSPRHEIGGEDTTRARPLVVGATNKTPLPQGFRGLCFDHGYYGRFSGPIPRFNFFPRTQQRFNFFCVWPATSLHLSSALHAAPSSRADASVTADGRLANPAPRRLPRGSQQTQAAAPFHHHVEARRRRSGSP